MRVLSVSPLIKFCMSNVTQHSKWKFRLNTCKIFQFAQSLRGGKIQLIEDVAISSFDSCHATLDKMLENNVYRKKSVLKEDVSIE